jgi:hypothetical protein
MSDRTFRLILDGKKGGLVKGSTPSSAAKKACKKLSAETGKTSFKFELQETTKDFKKKVYGPYKIKVKMAGGEPTKTQILLKYQDQLQRITDELRDILRKQTEFISKSDNNINKEINKLTQNVSFNQKESNRILSNIQEKKPKTNSIKLLNLVIARKIILNKIESLKKELWETPVEKYFPKEKVTSNTSLERKLQNLYNLQKEFKNGFGPNNTQFNNQIATLEKQIRERNLNGTSSVTNLEGQQISALSNQVPSRQNGKSTFVTEYNSLPTVSNMQRYIKNGKAVLREEQKKKNQAIKAARNKKFHHFNNNP